jgi:hypothetical protein
MSDLHEWADLLLDEIVVNQQVGRDAWGNPVIVTSEPVLGSIISRTKAGGNRSSGNYSEPADLWTLVVVFPETSPTPEVGSQITINDQDYTVRSLTVYQDHLGQAFEATCNNIPDEESAP